MHIQESGEMYLETIYVLTKQKPSVRAIDVSEHMGFSKPSVSRAVGLLKDAELLEVEAGGALRLTEKGLDLAKKIYERHNILTEFLVKLGVKREIATADACKIEHVISDESLDAIRKELSND